MNKSGSLSTGSTSPAAVGNHSPWRCAMGLAMMALAFSLLLGGLCAGQQKRRGTERDGDEFEGGQEPLAGNSMKTGFGH